MNVIRKMSPHAAILIANMYFVLFGIDRVNTAMNFINNGYTKFLLAVMLACCAVIVMDLLARRNRSRGDGNDLQRLIFIGAGALLNVALAVILLTDAILGNRGMPFLSEPVKIVTLLACIANWVNGFRMIGAVRADLRAEQARRAAARRNAQRRPARRPQPARSRYDDGYGSSRSADGYGARSRYADSTRHYENDRYGDIRRSGYAGEDGIRRSSRDESYARSSRYSQDGYSRSARYGEESRAGSSRYEDGYSRSSRYGEERYSDESSRASRYEESGKRSRYADGYSRASRYGDYDRSANRSRSGGYDGEVGGISRSASRYSEGESVRRTSRYTDEY